MDAHATETVDEIRRLTNAALGRAEMPPITPKPDRAGLEFELRNAETHEAVDSVPEGGGIGRKVKLAVMKLTSFSWSRQRSVNHSLRQSVLRLMDEIDDLRARLDVNEQRSAMRSAVTATELRRLTSPNSAADESNPAPIVTRNARGQTPSVTRNHQLEGLYSRLEAAFRPGDAVLAERLSEYIGDLEFLRDGALPLLDIGCGRGDFLSVLRDAGIPGRGIDQNTDAVAEAIAKGLDVVQGDALDYLATLSTGSIGAVSALHVVEHLSPAVCLELIDEALRVLAPGGLLILETPNPTNLAVGAASFYLDPTHVRPVPADYLQFLVRDRGFGDVHVRFLHPLPEYESTLDAPSQTDDKAFAALIDDVKWALKGPQDYVVLARRPGR